MILVVGGGFGLYGHVAALVGAGREVATLAEYRVRAEARPEMADVIPRIRWVDDMMAAAREAEAVVLARTPRQNAELARAILGSPNRSPELVEGRLAVTRGALRQAQGYGSGDGPVLIMEKPVAETPAAAAVLEAEMVAAGQRWAVPYLFAECDWADAVRDALAAGKSVEIDWAHRQSPMVRGWKREEEHGGGAIAFYFIHCIALAETLLPGCEPVVAVLHDDADRVVGCNLTANRHCERSEAIQSCARNSGLLRFARNDGLGQLAFKFTLGVGSDFSVSVDGQTALQTTTPFGPIPAAGSPDPRIPMLVAFHRRVAEQPDFQPPVFHAAVTRHWAALETLANA